jgi:predicted alpha/beta-fold hydrolase
MPIIKKSTYHKAPFYQFNGNLQTIVPSFTRQIKGVTYERERLSLSDGDFVDLDWIDSGQKKLVILTHGLEGNTQRHYILGAAKFFVQEKWDVLAWNCRSCSGEMNRMPRLYNHGEIGDIAEVINHALKTKDYEKVVLIGYSMGGSITLKYLGVNAPHLPPQIYKGIAYSAPCKLASSAASLNRPSNWVYKRKFLSQLSYKMKAKAVQFPNLLDIEKLKHIEKWADFDEYFSAPLNGFNSAAAFYEFASAENFMSTINIPTLLVNAQNDPIIPPDCSPTQLCEKHPFIYLENPTVGGHIGFAEPSFSRHKEYSWMETRAIRFIQAH